MVFWRKAAMEAYRQSAGCDFPQKGDSQTKQMDMTKSAIYYHGIHSLQSTMNLAAASGPPSLLSSLAFKVLHCLYKVTRILYCHLVVLSCGCPPSPCRASSLCNNQECGFASCPPQWVNECTHLSCSDLCLVWVDFHRCIRIKRAIHTV